MSVLGRSGGAPRIGCGSLESAKRSSCRRNLSNEFYAVASRKIGIPRDKLRERIWRLDRWTTAPLDLEATREAWLIEDQTGYHFWDCLLLASAAFAGCRTFLSEDLQHERRVGAITIINPFVVAPSEILPPF